MVVQSDYGTPFQPGALEQLIMDSLLIKAGLGLSDAQFIFATFVFDMII